MNKPLVINIQKCSIHDGPGIRTTIFFKGCPLQCTWCHNPESQSYSKEVLYNEEGCSKCMACINKCPQNAISATEGNIRTNKGQCRHCKICLDYCVNNARELVGMEYEVKKLVKEIYKDILFYDESGGGVTLSGGEVMTQDIHYIEELVKQCRDRGINVAIDTCGYAKWENFERVLPHVNLFLYDIKLIDNQKHIDFTGKSNNLILDNLKKLAKGGADINIRIPLIEGVNCDEDNSEINRMIDFLRPLKIENVNLLPYHNIGIHKYEKLDIVYNGDQLARPTDEKLDEIKKIFESNNFSTKLGG